jgi:Uma2 family endonuclease
MTQTATKFPLDTWIKISWDEYLQVVESLAYKKAACYYYDGKGRIEMTPLGSNHAQDHFSIGSSIQLFASLRDIDIKVYDNCSYRKAGYQEVQPDLSVYVGEKANAIPWGTGIVDLNQFPPPDLVIEVGDSSIADDKGEKRLLYESLAVGEYWIVDVQKAEIIALAMENGGSRQIRESVVLPGLAMSLLEEALQRTRESNHGKVGAWLLKEFQAM